MSNLHGSVAVTDTTGGRGREREDKDDSETGNNDVNDLLHTDANQQACEASLLLGIASRIPLSR